MTLVGFYNVRLWPCPLAKLRSNSDRCVGLHERRERIFLRVVENSCVVSGEMVLAIKNGIATSLSLLMSNSLFPGCCDFLSNAADTAAASGPAPPRSPTFVGERELTVTYSAVTDGVRPCAFYPR